LLKIDFGHILRQWSRNLSRSSNLCSKWFPWFLHHWVLIFSCRLFCSILSQSMGLNSSSCLWKLSMALACGTGCGPWWICSRWSLNRMLVQLQWPRRKELKTGSLLGALPSANYFVHVGYRMLQCCSSISTATFLWISVSAWQALI
jgi:hypothetical protein